MSTSVPPASWKVTSCAAASSGSVSTPHVIVPRPSWETFRPLRPTRALLHHRLKRYRLAATRADRRCSRYGGAVQLGLNLGYWGAADDADEPRSWSRRPSGSATRCAWAAEAYGSDAVDRAGLDRRADRARSTSAARSCRSRPAPRR